jgi:riboflavin synthase
MFTGIIAHVGTLQKKEKSIFTFKSDALLIPKLENGTSISVNGVCLTVLSKPKSLTFSIEIMPETAKKTNLDALSIGDVVNLELPATAETFLSGHVVQGHVDGVSTIEEIIPVENSHLFTFSLPKDLKKYIVDKGSIAINGISLTVISVAKKTFSVGVIPYTWKHTMLHHSKKGDIVNIEVDVFAKYVEKMLVKE